MTHYRLIHDTFWRDGAGTDVWMIVDCARDQQRIFRFLLECHLDYSCLYSGYLPPVLEMAAPYLVKLDFDREETNRLIELAWGNSWGVFLRCGTTLSKLRRHLRTFLMVRDTHGRRLAFRYYDPRVLRAYLPTCTREELQTIYGPVERFWMEDQHGAQQMLEFGLDAGRLVRKTLVLT